MAKRLVARVGSYIKDGQEKGEYVNIGVILSNDNGEYALIDPTVNLAGVLMKQNEYNEANGRTVGTSVMCGIFDSNRQSNQQQAPQQSQPAPDFNDDVPF